MRRSTLCMPDWRQHAAWWGLFLAFAPIPLAYAQAPATPPAAPQAAAQRPQAPQFPSPEVAPDGRITFRIFAPQAGAVRLSAGDIVGLTPDKSQLTKAENGVWEVTVGPVAPGAYRYTYSVDGVATVDPRNPATSESNNNAWSLVAVSGSDLWDTKDVPHGAVAEVTYHSGALGRPRRMHVYTPPGYEKATASYPVFYLLHGAGDSDDAWSTVGRAGFILDNLIAARKARPMIVVMPAGHTARGAASATARNATEEFVNDFVQDVVPYVEGHYRVLGGAQNTAIAGLSMGGNHALQVAIPRLEKFGYIGVYSSGLLGAFPELAPARRGAAPAAPAAAPPTPTAAAPARATTPLTAVEWEKLHAAKLDNPGLKKGVRLLWFATGKDDFLLTTTRATVDLFKKHGFTPVYLETDGGHTWVNWRQYLAEFVPQLFAGRTGS